jgi:hypothetical protein
MSKLGKLDKIIGEALEQASKAASIIRDIDELDNKVNLRFIGDALVKLSSVRDNIYDLEPSLKLDFIELFEKDEDLYEVLTNIQKEAVNHERKGDIEEARSFYTELLKKSKIGHFTRIAEAGLYRVSK